MTYVCVNRGREQITLVRTCCTVCSISQQIVSLVPNRARANTGVWGHESSLQTRTHVFG